MGFKREALCCPLSRALRALAAGDGHSPSTTMSKSRLSIYVYLYHLYSYSYETALTKSCPTMRVAAGVRIDGQTKSLASARSRDIT